MVTFHLHVEMRSTVRVGGSAQETILNGWGGGGGFMCVEIVRSFLL